MAHSFRFWMRIGVVVVLCVSVAIVRAARATYVNQDVAAIRTIAAASLQSLGNEIFAPPPPALTLPWIVTVPDTLNPAWQNVRSVILRVLQARIATDRDSLARFITFHPVDVSFDSLTGHVEIGTRWRCGTGWTISSRAIEFRSARVNGHWQPAQEKVVIMADPTVCPASR